MSAPMARSSAIMLALEIIDSAGADQLIQRLILTHLGFDNFDAADLDAEIARLLAIHESIDRSSDARADDGDMQRARERDEGAA